MTLFKSDGHYFQGEMNDSYRLTVAECSVWMTLAGSRDLPARAGSCCPVCPCPCTSRGGSPDLHGGEGPLFRASACAVVGHRRQRNGRVCLLRSLEGAGEGISWATISGAASFQTVSVVFKMPFLSGPVSVTQLTCHLCLRVGEVLL